MLKITGCNFNVIITHLEVCDVPFTKKYLDFLEVFDCDVFAQLMMQVLLVLYIYRAILNYCIFASYVGQILLYCKRRNHKILKSIIQRWVGDVRCEIVPNLAEFMLALNCRPKTVGFFQSSMLVKLENSMSYKMRCAPLSNNFYLVEKNWAFCPSWPSHSRVLDCETLNMVRSIGHSSNETAF